MTVYQTVLNFEKKTNHRLAQGQKKMVGGKIKKQFSIAYPGHALPIVTSVEPKGTFKVFDYPDHFIPRMEEIIADYAEEIKAEKAKKISKRIIEKPKQTTPQNSTSEPTKKKRKRIPLQPTYTTPLHKK
jgi:hypothetical protein